MSYKKEPMKHRHGHWTRHRHMDTCNVQNIECSTGVVSVSDTDTDACRTPDTGLGCPCFIERNKQISEKDQACWTC